MPQVIFVDGTDEGKPEKGSNLDAGSIGYDWLLKTGIRVLGLKKVIPFDYMVALEDASGRSLKKIEAGCRIVIKPFETKLLVVDMTKSKSPPPMGSITVNSREVNDKLKRSALAIMGCDFGSGYSVLVYNANGQEVKKLSLGCRVIIKKSLGDFDLQDLFKQGNIFN